MIALVTGGNQGIGKAIAARLVADGAQVAICGRNQATLEAAASELGGGAPGVAWQVLDVTDRQSVDRIVAEVAHVLGGLDVVINNAGVIDRAAFLEITPESWHHVIDVNLTGAFHVTRAAAPHMENGGRIVNISSVVGLFGVPDNAPYVASKHGLLGLTKVASLELAPRGITVNAVCPGWTDTPMTEAGIESLAASWGMSPEAARARIVTEMIPIGRLLRPDEIAGAVSWLCSEEAAAVTGRALVVDGGQSPF